MLFAFLPLASKMICCFFVLVVFPSINEICLHNYNISLPFSFLTFSSPKLHINARPFISSFPIQAFQSLTIILLSFVGFLKFYKKNLSVSRNSSFSAGAHISVLLQVFFVHISNLLLFKLALPLLSLQSLKDHCTHFLFCSLICNT